MSGSEALAIAASWDPDLIVLDCRVPDIEGVEVGRRLRRAGLKTGILFVTAKDRLEHKIEALRADGDDYVTNPFFLLNPNQILSKLQIIENVWPDSHDSSSNLAEMFVGYLRRKLDVAGPPLIVTVRQMGYILDEPRG